MRQHTNGTHHWWTKYQADVDTAAGTEGRISWDHEQEKTDKGEGMNRAEEFISARVEELADDNDERFIGHLATYLQQRDAAGVPLPVYTRLLFAPAILARLARIRRESPSLFLGGFATVLRRRRDLYYPDVMAAIDGFVRTFDPFSGTDGGALMDEPIRPVRWLVPGLIANGLTILGGTPKSGKSYLAYALTLAVAVYGRLVQHWEVEQGPVLFVSLEDDVDDTRQRLAELDPDLTLARGMVHFIHGLDQVPPFDEGLIPWLMEAIKQYRPRLVVIDPISYLYSLSKRGSSDLFSETRQMLFPLRWLGKEHQCAIVALDHRRKRSRDDTNVFDTLHGSIAKQAIADALLMVERSDEEITLAALVRRGRDATHHLTMQFRDGRCWLEYKGESPPKVDTGQYGALRQKIYTALLNYSQAMSVSELLGVCEMPDTRSTRNQLYLVLFRAQKEGDVHKVERGKYIWANRDQPAT